MHKGDTFNGTVDSLSTLIIHVNCSNFCSGISPRKRDATKVSCQTDIPIG